MPKARSAADPTLTSAIRTVIRLSRLAQQVCDEFGLTLPQYRALSMAVGTRRRAYEIASYTAVSRPATAAVTAGLERIGLMQRMVAESDRRGVYFVATRKGEKIIADIEAQMVERFTEIFGDDVDLLRSLASASIDAALDAQAFADFATPDDIPAAPATTNKPAAKPVRRRSS